MRLDTRVVNSYLTCAMKETVWEWLSSQERSVTWLARHTARKRNTVYRYRDGSRTAPAEWIAAVEQLAGRNFVWRNRKDEK